MIYFIIFQKHCFSIFHLNHTDTAVWRYAAMPEILRILIDILEKSTNRTAMRGDQYCFCPEFRIQQFFIQNSLVRARTSEIFSPFSGLEKWLGSVKNTSISLLIIFPFSSLNCVPSEPRNLSPGSFIQDYRYPACLLSKNKLCCLCGSFQRTGKTQIKGNIFQSFSHFTGKRYSLLCKRDICSTLNLSKSIPLRLSMS